MKKYFVLCALVVAACTSQVSSEDDSLPTPENDASVDNKNDAGFRNINDAGEDTNQDVDANEPDASDSVPQFVFQKFDINHVLITGQSNSVANSANPITVSQPYSNLSFNVGVMPGSSCDGNGCKVYDKPNDFKALVEGDTFFTGGRVETASSGFANQISKFNHDFVSLVSLHGRSGNTYWCLSKGGCNYKVGYISPFDQGMNEVRDGKAIAESKNKSYVVRAVLAIHGESDHYSYTTGTQEFPRAGLNDYSDALLQWQKDYDTGVKEITAQGLDVPLFISQVSGWNDTKESRLAQMQVDAHKRSNGKVILVAPGYPLSFQSDCLHFSSDGQRRLGAYFSKAFRRVIIQGGRWEPVRPKSITKDGNLIMIKYYVPVPPLVLDTTRISNPGNYGFGYSDDVGTQIVSVSLTNSDTVAITLSQTPGANARLTYAQNQVPKTCIGVQGARGNLRDSDTTPNEYNYEMFNWGVHFTENL